VIPIWEKELSGGRHGILFIWFLKEEELGLVWFDCQACSLEPVVAYYIPGPEKILDVVPGFCTSKDDTIVNVLAKQRVIPVLHVG
jgi:hypothetical protein